MMISEIFLFSLLEKLLARPQAMGLDGSCKELEEWNRRWAHLFGGCLRLKTRTTLTRLYADVEDDRARAFDMNYWFACLVLAQRSLKRLIAVEVSSPNDTSSFPPCFGSPSSSRSSETDFSASRAQYVRLCQKFAMKVLRIFSKFPIETIEEVPEWFWLEVAYSIIVLTEFFEESSTKEETSDLLKIVNCTNRSILRMLVPVVEAVVRDPPEMSHLSTTNSAGAGVYATGQVDLEGFSHWNYPTLEDVFSGSFLINPGPDGMNFDLPITYDPTFFGNIP